MKRRPNFGACCKIGCVFLALVSKNRWYECWSLPFLKQAPTGQKNLWMPEVEAFGVRIPKGIINQIMQQLAKNVQNMQPEASPPRHFQLCGVYGFDSYLFRTYKQINGSPEDILHWSSCGRSGLSSKPLR